MLTKYNKFPTKNARKYPVSRKYSIPRNLQFNQEERKYLDNNLASADPTSSGLVVGLINIAEGTDFNQRVGRKVKLMYIQYDLIVTSTAVAPLPVVPTGYNFHIVLDRQPNNSLATIGQVLDTTVTPAVSAMKNIGQYAERFKILKTVKGLLYTGNTENCRFNGYVKLNTNQRDSQCQFLSSAAASPTVNNILLVFAQNGGANACIFDGNLRVVYTDM